MRERQEDLWAAGYKAQAVCITTNGYIKDNGCAVMGAGVALEAKERWPNLPSMLGKWLQTTGIKRPHLFVIPPKTLHAQPFALVCLPVKFHWKAHANAELIAQSLAELVDAADMFAWQRIVLPRPGCGNGKLDWDTVVKPLCSKLDDRFLVVHK